jgi:hypothetical protein
MLWEECVSAAILNQAKQWCKSVGSDIPFQNVQVFLLNPVYTHTIQDVSLSLSLSHTHTHTHIVYFGSYVDVDCLCGLVIKSLRFDSRLYWIFWILVGLERGPLILTRIIEEPLEATVVAPVKKTEINGHATPSTRKICHTSPAVVVDQSVEFTWVLKATEFL